MTQNVIINSPLYPKNGVQLFEKRNVIELTDEQMSEVDAGTGPACIRATTAIGAAAVAAFNAGYAFGQWLAS